MRLVFRRTHGARSLLIAAATATLIATALLTGLTEYSRAVIQSGISSAVASSAAQERSILIHGAAGASSADLRQRDSALRAGLRDGLNGRTTRVSSAGYAAGRQFAGPVGSAVPGADGLVFASVVFLEHLADHAELNSGSWPEPGATPIQTALAESVAAILGVGVGDEIPITDRFTNQVTEVTVAGVWRPRDVQESYWQLVPDVDQGVAPQSATYGPLVVHRSDFLAHFVANASAGWLVEPDLTGATLAELTALAAGVTEAVVGLPEVAGLGSSGLATTQLPEFVDRLERADLVGRSALVTPILLIVVLGGYALILVAALLTEHRRAETALLRARGAARGQLAGLALRESLLVVLPAAALAPLLATGAVRLADRTPMLASTALWVNPRIDALTWLVAGLAALGCGLAILGPALRRSDSYVGEQASRSRPNRRAVASRAGVDLALVALAALGWFQLRQYASPLAGSRTGDGLGIDPLLAATPTMAVLAGAVLALRALPPVTRLAERYVARKPWTATIFGIWQAGRRPHAGPVLLVALAVAVSTLAWCLASTYGQSLTDQADHQVGADLRLVERDGSPPADRADQLAGLPGVATVLPAWRDTLRLDTQNEQAGLLALDTAAAGQVVRVRDDLAGGDPGAVFNSMSSARIAAGATELPAGTRRLTGELRTIITGRYPDVPAVTSAVLTGPGGNHQQVTLGTSEGGRPLRFAVDLPTTSTPLRLAGFFVKTAGRFEEAVEWQLAALHAETGDGIATPLALADGGPWQLVDRAGTKGETAPQAGVLTARYRRTVHDNRSLPTTPLRFAVVHTSQSAPVPMVATPQALAGLRLKVGDQTRLPLAGVELDVRITGSMSTVPGTATAAFLVDLPSLRTELLHQHGILIEPQEWWLATRPGEQATAAEAAARLDGLRVYDRQAIARDAGRDPYGVGARTALFGAALGAILLAAVGITVDVRATARRRINELAVLHTLGAGRRLLTRSIVIEQTFLAGIGVLVGLVVGIVVAATMAPLVILTPSAERPVPTPSLAINWLPVGATAAVLLLLALGLSGLIATTLRQRLAAAQLHLGEDQ